MGHFETRMAELKKGWDRVGRAAPQKPIARPPGRLPVYAAAEVARVLIFGLEHALERAAANDEAEVWVAFEKMRTWLDHNLQARAKRGP